MFSNRIRSGPSPLNKDRIPVRGARMARRDDREYRGYLREEQRSQPGCSARKRVLDQRRQATSPESLIPVGCAALVLALLICLAPVLRLDAASGRRIAIRAEDGVALTGIYYEPSRRPAPGIVLLHMLRRSHEDWDAAASYLADAGFAVVAIDFRAADDDLSPLALDVRAAKTFLRERPEVMPTSIGIAGGSIGANLALIDAADDPSVRSVAMLSPGIDYRGLRIDAAMKKFGARPALLVGSTKDPYTWRSIKQLEAMGPGPREVQLTDAIAHGTVLLARDPALIPALVDWFRRTLL
jgi:dienelactone hydrolase